MSKKRVMWEEASAHLRMDKAKLAAFAELYPAMLTRQGEADMDLSLRPGLNVDGRLTIQDGRTRPVSSLGPIRDISLELRFHEHTARLQRATANIGGAEVELLAGRL